MTTHFRQGVTNVPRYDRLGVMKVPDPATYAMWFDDFMSYTSGNWIFTHTASTPTNAVISGAGGILSLANTASSADLDTIQWGGGTGAVVLTHYLNSNYDFCMNCRFSMDNATNAAVLIGVASAATNPISSAPTDGIWFYKASGATSLVGVMSASSTQTTQTIGSMANATYAEATIAYRRDSASWSVYFNNGFVGSSSTITNFPASTTGLAPIIAVQNGTAAARTLNIDYLMIAEGRYVVSPL